MAAGAGGEAVPMLEVQLELSGAEVVYVPEIGEAAGGGNSVSGLAHTWIKSFLETATLLKRLDTGDGEVAVLLCCWKREHRFANCLTPPAPVLVPCSSALSCAAHPRLSTADAGLQTHQLALPLRLPLHAAGTYAKELDEDVRVRAALSAVQLALLDTEERCAAFRQQFAQYSHLWERDMQQALRSFLASGMAGGGEQGPALEVFAAELARFKVFQDEVQALPASVAVGWVRVDARPIKQVRVPAGFGEAPHLAHACTWALPHASWSIII